jgi:starvation-inducible DNA-binding protein
MDLTNLQTALEEAFAGNFVSYYRAHVSHVNVIGKDFYQYHKLLQKVYSYLGDNIDDIAEKLRTIKAVMPQDLNTVLGLSPIADMPVVGDADQMLRDVLESIESLIDLWHAVDHAAEEVDYVDIANFSQDQIGNLAKFKWMLEATLDE